MEEIGKSQSICFNLNTSRRSMASKTWLSFAIVLVASVLSNNLFGQAVDLEKLHWIHGSANCSENKDPGLQVLKFNETTYILRQNKCLNYEAPFLYLFIGREKALLVDTGAEAPDDSFPLYETVRKILSTGKGMLPLLVIHSHGHGDHNAGDGQFTNKAGVELVPPTKEAIVKFFQLNNWPDDEAELDLGQRKLTIIPIPGHDVLSVAIYDPQTKWLLTGDSIYPGRLYVRDGAAFCGSIARLTKFANEHAVTYLMGNHIEMTTTKGVDYPTGTTYQPEEHVLPLGLSVIKELSTACERMQNKIVYEVHDSFIIVPK